MDQTLIGGKAEGKEKDWRDDKTWVAGAIERGGLETDTRKHERVNHSKEEWVVGDVHTNSVEGVWSLFKRSIAGSFHKMSVKHMDRHLEELEWRFNNRGNPCIFQNALRRIINTHPLEYRTLVAE